MRLILLLLIYLVFLSDCSTITSQTYPVIDDSAFQNIVPDKKLKLRINYYSGMLGKQTRSHQLNNDLVPEIKKIFLATKWFSEVQIVEKFKDQRFSSSHFNEHPKNLDDDFRQATPAEMDCDLQLSIYIQSNGIISSKLKNILPLLTFSLIPVNEEHSYKISFQLHSKKLNANAELMFDELYNIRTSLIPLPGETASYDTGQPVLNVIKAALLDYQKNGILK